jgi:hypothetical protein
MGWAHVLLQRTMLIGRSWVSARLVGEAFATRSSSSVYVVALLMRVGKDFFGGTPLALSVESVSRSQWNLSEAGRYFPICQWHAEPT